MKIAYLKPVLLLLFALFVTFTLCFLSGWMIELKTMVYCSRQSSLTFSRSHLKLSSNALSCSSLNHLDCTTSSKTVGCIYVYQEDTNIPEHYLTIHTVFAVKTLHTLFCERVEVRLTTGRSSSSEESVKAAAVVIYSAPKGVLEKICVQYNSNTISLECTHARTCTHAHMHPHKLCATYRVAATGPSTSLADRSSL